MYPKFLSFFLLLFTLSTLGGCTQPTADKPKKAKPEHLVETASVSYGDLGVTVTRTGSLKVQREVKIFTQEEGRVTALPFHEGDKVRKGTLVAQLDDELLQAQLRRAQATLHKSQQDIKRLRNLYQRKLVSDEEVAQAETAFEVARADEQLLETRLGYTRITAPISGIVTQRLTEPGNIAERYDHLLTIADPSSLITEVTVSELLLPALKVGDATQVRIDALGASHYPGVITRIHPSLDPVTRRGIIEVALKPVPSGARPGQLCRVTLATNTGPRLTIPFRALRRDTEGEYVFRLDEQNRAQRVAVSSGQRIGERVEILSGVTAGQQVVTKGFLSLKSGTKVKPVHQAGSADNEQIPVAAPE
jgi:membrane fusion protein (multidrug efflux system)